METLTITPNEFNAIQRLTAPKKFSGLNDNELLSLIKEDRKHATIY